MRKQKTIHYIYKTICLVTDRYYIGMHSTHTLEDGYMGSGKRLRASIRKHGEENHKVEILEFFDNRELLIEAEKAAITEDMITDKDCMNLMGGGTGGFISEEQQRHRSQCANKKLNEKLENDDEFHNEFSYNVSKGLIASKNTRDNKNWYSKGFTDKTHSDETKGKISETMKGKGKGNTNSQYGTRWITNGDWSMKIDKSEDIPEGWKAGRYIK